MQKIIRVAKKKKIIIIEDAAEMIGQKYKKKICGSFGTAHLVFMQINILRQAREV